MFGDDLKQSLESIQVSDELLAKTRLAIEKARIEQAAQSVEVKKKSSRSLARLWKIAIPVACTALIVGGMVLLIPKLSKKDSMNGDVSFSVRSTSAAENHCEETTCVEESEAIDYADEAEEGFNHDITKGSPLFVDDSPTSNSNVVSLAVDIEGEWAKANTSQQDLTQIKFDTYRLCISRDGKSLELRDLVTDELLSDNESRVTPQINDLDDNRFIYAVVYDDINSSLIITTVNSMDPMQITILDFYLCTYIDGQLVDGDPMYIYSTEI